MSRNGPAPRGTLNATDGCRNTRPGPSPCFRLFFTTNTATSTCPRRMATRTRGAIVAYGASSYGASRTWRQAAGRAAIFGPRAGFAAGRGPGWVLPRRRRPGVKTGVGEPIRELLAAAVVRRPRRLRFAFRVVGRADEP